MLSALLVLLIVRYKQGAGNAKKQKTGRPSESGRRLESRDHAADGTDWMSQVSQSVSETENSDWGWDSAGQVETSTAAVSAQEVDPLTEYQVYKQFGYESKAAASLAGYLNGLADGAPEKLVHELIGLNLRTGDIDLLADTLERHGNVLPEESLAEYVKAGLLANSTHLQLRVIAERRLGWNMQEVSRQIGEKTSLEEIQSAVSAPVLTINTENTSHINSAGADKRTPIVIGRNTDLDSVTEEEMGAVIGFVKPEKSAKILRGKVDYETALRQYNKAIQKSTKPASLIIDALKLDYQNEEVNQFAKHLWKLYYTLGQYGRQVKERMLGWGYSLGYHEVFDDLERGPSEQKVREIGLARGYLQPTSMQLKSKYRDLVQKDDSLINANSSPAEEAIKEVESLLMYGQLDQAIGTLEQAVLQYPQESQLYIMLFDLYERAEDWSRLEQFLRLLRERVASLPEEVVLAMSRLLRRVNQHSKQ
ncbi:MULTISPECIES: M48 family metallopeptidase [unclassified Neisseria]|uniref:tetratricopeptide repeat protein n=1 Tax=unclassified Neisseria TaxID=2623750 RepID=UPI001071686B|nr:MULTISPECIES: 23S rRNA methyltransferase [unclassified Neisseria]MBF0803878.1 23S rRNA methyltransferase [Neisseria sp. 19428wB4_WF04]TFU43413.1 23S rRNA methyltransferase [Neisseria sp. WF04]